MPDPASPRLRIVLAEDHVTVRQGLRLLIDAQPDLMVVGEAGDGRTALQRVQELAPDVVVMDISMPGTSGLTAARVLKDSNKEIAAQLELSVKTVEVHKANAMRKLGLRRRIDIVRFAIIQGWMGEG
jgi:DNA-binding NarL/FixJ family response regulator